MPWIALLTLSVSIDLVSSSARVTSVKFQKHHSLSDGHPDTKIEPGTPGSDKNCGTIPLTEDKCSSKKKKTNVLKVLKSKEWNK